MKNLFSSFIIFILTFVVLMTACNSADEPIPAISITAKDFSASIDENPTNGFIIGTVQASASDNSTLNYTLSNQSIAGAIAIDANTGELSIADASVFGIENNTSITANYKTSNGTEEATGNITIIIGDIDNGLIVGENGLIAHYTFDNTLSDAMGNFPDLIIKGKSGGTSLNTDRKGISNSAYKLDSAYFELAHNDSLFSEEKVFTISIWVRPTERTEIRMVLFSKLGDYQLRAEPGWRVGNTSFTGRAELDVFADDNDEYQAGALYSLGSQPRVDEWNHFAMVCDGSTAKIYHNGTLLTPNVSISAINPISKNNPTWIGARMSNIARGSTDEFIGDIDEYRYYNQALTETQIQALANDL